MGSVGVRVQTLPSKVSDWVGERGALRRCPVGLVVGKVEIAIKIVSLRSMVLAWTLLTLLKNP